MKAATHQTTGLFVALAAVSCLATAAFAQESTETSQKTEETQAAGADTSSSEGSGKSEADTTDANAGAAGGEGAAAEPGGSAPAASEPATTEQSGQEAPAVNLQTAEQEYDIRVRGLEGRINDLKEQIFRSKAKLTLLTEQVTGGLGTGAGATIIHKNEMGGRFLLTEAHYFLDGTPLWQEVDETGERLTEMREHPVWDGNIVEGSHTLTVNLVYRGNGSGVFSYLSGYVFELKDSFNFTAEAGKVITIYVSGYEKGNFTTELVDRPDIKFEPKVRAQENPANIEN